MISVDEISLKGIMRKFLLFLFFMMALFTGLQVSAQGYEYYDRIPTFNTIENVWEYDPDSHPAWITTVNSGEWTFVAGSPVAVGPDGQFRFGSSDYDDGSANSANAPWGTVSSPNFDVDKSLILELDFTQSNNAGQKNEPEIIFDMTYKDEDGKDKTVQVTIKLYLKSEKTTISVEPSDVEVNVTEEHVHGTHKYIFTVPFPDDYYSDGHMKMSLRATGGLEVGTGTGGGAYSTIDVYGDNLVLRDDWDNAERLRRNAGKKMRKVTIVRSYDKGWYTLSLPFDLTMKQFQRRFMAGFVKANADTYTWKEATSAEIWEYTSFSNNIMQFTKSYGEGSDATVLKAAVPYLIYVPNSIESTLVDFTSPAYTEAGSEDIQPGDKVMVFTNVPLASEATLFGSANVVEKETGYKFVSNLSKTNLADENANVMADYQVYYLHTDPDGENPKLYKPSSASTNIKGFRAYFTSPKEGSGTNPSALSFDNSMTSIGAVELLSTADGRVYNLQGQLVNKSLDELPRGIYIVNHKKYVVK